MKPSGVEQKTNRFGGAGHSFRGSMLRESTSARRKKETHGRFPCLQEGDSQQRGRLKSKKEGCKRKKTEGRDLWNKKNHLELKDGQDRTANPHTI